MISFINLWLHHTNAKHPANFFQDNDFIDFILYKSYHFRRGVFLLFPVFSTCHPTQMPVSFLHCILHCFYYQITQITMTPNQNYTGQLKRNTVWCVVNWIQHICSRNRITLSRGYHTRDRQSENFDLKWVYFVNCLSCFSFFRIKLWSQVWYKYY